MISSQGIIRFLIWLVVIEAILLAPWPVLGGVYRIFFDALGNLVIDGVSVGKDIRFRSLQPPEGSLDIEVSMTDAIAGVRASMPISSRYFGWMPTAFAVALTWATPLPWKRRLRGLLLMLVMANVMVIARVWLNVQVNLGVPPGSSGTQSWSWLKPVVTSIDGAFAVPMIGWYVGPLLCWIIWLFGLEKLWSLPTNSMERKKAPVD